MWIMDRRTWGVTCKCYKHPISWFLQSYSLCLFVLQHKYCDKTITEFPCHWFFKWSYLLCFKSYPPEELRNWINSWHEIIVLGEWHFHLLPDKVGFSLISRPASSFIYESFVVERTDSRTARKCNNVVEI
jgi:hypothetical protein